MTKQLWRSFLSIFHHPSLQCQLICSAAWLWRARATSWHVTVCWNYCIFPYSTVDLGTKLLWLLAGHMIFLFASDLQGEITEFSGVGPFWVCFCAPALDCNSSPHFHHDLTAVMKALAAFCSSCSLYSQIITALVTLLIFFCDFLKVLPQPKYTIPAEASEHWPQEDNYTPCRKSWWIPLRWLSQAVLSHSIESFLMFCPAGTRDDGLVCCLPTYSSFVLDFFFQSVAPLG